MSKEQSPGSYRFNKPTFSFLSSGYRTIDTDLLQITFRILTVMDIGYD